MQIQLEPQTVELLQRASAMLNVDSYDKVIVQAVSETLEHAAREAGSNGRESGKQVLDRFRRFRGTLQGATVDEIAAMRHEGLR